MGFFGKLSSRLSSVIPCVAAAAACVASFPHPTDAAFVTGGGKLPNCDTIQKRDDVKCGSVGGATCPETRKRCRYNIAVGTTMDYLCKPGQGKISNGCNKHPSICAPEKHDLVTSYCVPTVK